MRSGLAKRAAGCGGVVGSSAEVLGAAIAMKLLFGLPLIAGVVLTTLQVLVVLALQGKGLRRLEGLVVAGQVVMEGFTDLRLRPWVRRLGSRAITVAPAVLAITVLGEQSATRLLIFSQVVLSLQLPFAVVPLIRLTGDRRLMGVHVNGRWVSAIAWLAAAMLVAMNGWLLVQLFKG